MEIQEKYITIWPIVHASLFEFLRRQNIDVRACIDAQNAQNPRPMSVIEMRKSRIEYGLPPTRSYFLGLARRLQGRDGPKETDEEKVGEIA